MGFNIGGIFKSIVKTVAPAVISAIQGPATSLLKGVVGDLFTKGGAALNSLASKLPGPFAGLAQKLLGSALPKLTEMAQGGIEKLIQKLADSVTSRVAPGVGTVNLPAASAPERIEAQIANNPVVAAASAAASAAPAATSSAAATSTPSTIPTGDNLPPAALTGKDAEDIGKQNEFNSKMQSYQARLSSMNRYWEQLSTIYKAHDTTARAITQNFR